MVFSTLNQPVRPLSNWQRAVLYYLTDRATKAGSPTIVVKMTDMAEELGTTYRQVFRAAAALRKLGFVTSEQVKDERGLPRGVRFTVMAADPSRRQKVARFADALAVTPAQAMEMVHNLAKHGVPANATLQSIADRADYEGPPAALAKALSQAGLLVPNGQGGVLLVWF